MIGVIAKILNMPMYYKIIRLRTELYRSSILKKYFRGNYLKNFWFCKKYEIKNFEKTFKKVSSRNYPFAHKRLSLAVESNLESSFLGYKKKINSILEYGVSILGYLVRVNDPQQINWHHDPSSDYVWEIKYYGHYNHIDPNLNADIKYAWELSRLQWLIPFGQAYLIDLDEQKSNYALNVLKSWINNNPIGQGVNWSCTMEVSIRMSVLIWLLLTFSRSKSWSSDFCFEIFQLIYIHDEFIKDNLEVSDVNGNHLLANLTSLIISDFFFNGDRPSLWGKFASWLIKNEVRAQYSFDGVNIEGSIPYHRLSTEMLFIAATFIKASGRVVPDIIDETLRKASLFIDDYSQPNGLAPIIGDNDNGRFLPFGLQHINSHSYLSFLIKCYLSNGDFILSEGVNSEAIWWNFKSISRQESILRDSSIYKKSGFCILKSFHFYVLIRFGDLAFKGRGGHSHNDLLSIVVSVNEVQLFVDAGCPVYSGNLIERDRFRSTSSHNTPQVDKLEINRFNGVWGLHNDTSCDLLLWTNDSKSSNFCARHKGFVHNGVNCRVYRNVSLDKISNVLFWSDSFCSDERVLFSSPLLLDPSVTPFISSANCLLLIAGNLSFKLQWHATDGVIFLILPAEVSLGYGEVVPSKRLVWKKNSTSMVTINYSLSIL